MLLREALRRLLVQKGIFTKEEFLETVKKADHEIKLKRKLESGAKV